MLFMGCMLGTLLTGFFILYACAKAYSSFLVEELSLCRYLNVPLRFVLPIVMPAVLDDIYVFVALSYVRLRDPSEEDSVADSSFCVWLHVVHIVLDLFPLHVMHWFPSGS